MRLGFSKNFWLHDIFHLMWQAWCRAPGCQRKLPGSKSEPAQGFAAVQAEREFAMVVSEKGSILPGEVRRKGGLAQLEQEQGERKILESWALCSCCKQLSLLWDEAVWSLCPGCSRHGSTQPHFPGPHKAKQGAK